MKTRLVYLLVALSSLIALPAYAEESAEIAEESAEIAVDPPDLETHPARRVCFQPIVTGPCRAAFRRYAFDADTGRCVPFLYGGCQGNRNNFTSMNGCQRTCAYRAFPFRGR